MSFKSDQIQNLRLRLGWSQAELARQLGVDVQRVQQLEHGQRPSPSEFAVCQKWWGDLAEICDHVRSAPLAEQLMKDQGLSQVDQRALDLTP